MLGAYVQFLRVDVSYCLSYGASKYLFLSSYGACVYAWSIECGGDLYLPMGAKLSYGKVRGDGCCQSEQQRYDVISYSYRVK